MSDHVSDTSSPGEDQHGPSYWHAEEDDQTPQALGIIVFLWSSWTTTKTTRAAWRHVRDFMKPGGDSRVLSAPGCHRSYRASRPHP